VHLLVKRGNEAVVVVKDVDLPVLMGLHVVIFKYVLLYVQEVVVHIGVDVEASHV
jgi:hypothetical protein